MKLNGQLIIALSKLTDYLLVFQEESDKSKYLAQAGFNQANVDDLYNAILHIALVQHAKQDGENDFGIFYRIEGELIGKNGVILPVVTIWIARRDEPSVVRFITLKPRRNLS